MKKTTHIKSIIAIAAITIFAACKKEIYKPMSDPNATFKITPAAQVVNAAALQKPGGNGYAGMGTLGDTTKTGINP